jgi:DNA processing protein
MLAAGLARHGVTVVSGLARGIDGAAHQGALAGGGRTIAVLGSGIDIIYPAEHRRLAEEIIGHGALVSDYPVGTPPEAANFPPRNRIISGLSRGVVVVEGAEDSGALITADDAMEQGREVFAVPGNILARQSGGTNKLIQQGAKLVTSVEDILEDLNMVQATQQMEVQAAVPDNPLEARILTLLSGEPLHIDEISRQVGLPISQVSATLALMELKGMVHQVGSMTYVVARERRAGYHVD